MASPATWRTTQGGLVSLTLFNDIADNIILMWLDMMVEYQRLTPNRIGEAVGHFLGVFNADDGMVVYSDYD